MTRRTEAESQETEQELITKAQAALSDSNWVVGECAEKWTRKYAKGRSDADFGKLVGLSGDQIYQRRRVWEQFGGVRSRYRPLKWSHFYVALNWDDAEECLAWADENQTTVAEMQAWRRALRGEEFTGEPPSDPWNVGKDVLHVPTEVSVVQDATLVENGALNSSSAGMASSRSGAAGDPTVVGTARESEQRNADYAPFKQGAMHPASLEGAADTAVANRPLPSTAQIIGRMTVTLERCQKALTPEMAEEFPRLPQRTRDRFFKAVSGFSSQVAELMR